MKLEPLKKLIPQRYIARHGPRSGRRVALTFDDGPAAEATPRVLELLRQRGCRATFFLIGDRVEKLPDLVRQIVAEGHDIGNHTYGHRLDFAALDLPEMTRQFEEADRWIADAVGFRPRLVRPPFGAVTRSFWRFMRRDRRWPVVLWSRIPGGDQAVFDANADGLEHDVRSQGFRPGDIILLHDPEVSTVEGLSCVLDRLDELELSAVTVSELLGVGSVS